MLKRRWPLLLLLSLLVLFASLRTVLPGVFAPLREIGFDYQQRINPRSAPQSSDFVVIHVTERSQRAIGIWPWPRAVFGRYLCDLRRQGARAAAFDVYFGFPGADLPTQIQDLLANDPDCPFDAARDEGANDAFFAEQLAQLPSFLASFPRRQLGAPVSYSYTFPRTEFGDVNCFLDSRTFENGSEPYPPFIEAGAVPASILVDQNRQNILRRAPLFIRYVNQAASAQAGVPRYSFRTILFAQAAMASLGGGQPGQGQVVIVGDDVGGCDNAIAGWDGISQVIFDSTALMDIGSPYNRFITTDADATLRIMESPAVGAQIIDFIDFLREPGRYDLAGKVVFLGANEPGLDRDQFVGPLGIARPGVDFQAMAAEQILQGLSLWEPRWGYAAETLAFLVLGLLLGLLMLRARGKLLLAGPAVLLGPVALLAASVLAYRSLILVDGLTTAVLLAVLLAIMLAASLFLAERRKFAAQREFARFLPGQWVEELLKEGEEGQARMRGPRPVEAAILFGDIKSFSAQSADMSADEVFQFLDVTHQMFVEAVHSTGGVVDKFLGDGVMAFWINEGAHQNAAQRAFDAACKMIDGGRALNDDPRLNGTCNMRIGINFDRINIGYAGSEERLELTAVGAGVNLAARLEPIAGLVGFQMALSESMAQAVSNHGENAGYLIIPVGDHPMKNVGHNPLYGVMPRGDLAPLPEGLATALKAQRTLPPEKAERLIQSWESYLGATQPDWDHDLSAALHLLAGRHSDGVSSSEI